MEYPFLIVSKMGPGVQDTLNTIPKSLSRLELYWSVLVYLTNKHVSHRKIQELNMLNG